MTHRTDNTGADNTVATCKASGVQQTQSVVEVRGLASFEVASFEAFSFEAASFGAAFFEVASFEAASFEVASFEVASFGLSAKLPPHSERKSPDWAVVPPELSAWAAYRPTRPVACE